MFPMVATILISPKQIAVKFKIVLEVALEGHLSTRSNLVAGVWAYLRIQDRHLVALYSNHWRFKITTVDHEILVANLVHDGLESALKGPAAEQWNDLDSHDKAC